MGRWKIGTTPIAVQERIKHKTLVEMRLAGYSFEDIAKELHYESASVVQRQLRNLIAWMLKTPLEEYRSVNVLRLEEIIKVNWEDAMAKNDKATYRVLRAIHDISELCGLVVKTNHSDSPFGNPREVLIKLVYDRNRGNNDSLTDTPCLPEPDKTQSG